MTRAAITRTQYWRNDSWDLAFTLQQGRRIRRARRQAKLHQRDLANRVGCTWSHMSNIETGRNRLSARLLVKLAWALGVSVDELCPRIES